MLIRAGLQSGAENQQARFCSFQRVIKLTRHLTTIDKVSIEIINMDIDDRLGYLVS